jgi:hypothetical protein
MNSPKVFRIFSAYTQPSKESELANVVWGNEAGARDLQFSVLR